MADMVIKCLIIVIYLFIYFLCLSSGLMVIVENVISGYKVTRCRVLSCSCLWSAFSGRDSVKH